MDESIIGSCPAEIIKVSTNSDGSCRVTLDIGQVDIDIAEKMLSYKMKGDALVQVAFVKLNEEL
jgi:hypothetical protein